MAGSKPETLKSRAIIETVEAIGVPCIRTQSGRVPVRRGWMHLAPEGTPDFWTPLGWLEIKTEDGELSKAQQAWRDRFARPWGIRVGTIRDAATAAAVVGEWLREYRHAVAMGWK